MFKTSLVEEADRNGVNKCFIESWFSFIERGMLKHVERQAKRQARIKLEGNVNPHFFHFIMFRLEFSETLI